jgi:hypothetical protein
VSCFARRNLARSSRRLAYAAILFVGCGGPSINLGSSETGQVAAGSASAGGPHGCDALSCVTPCAYTGDYEGGGATGVLFCDSDGQCTSPLPQCHGAVGHSGAPAGGGAFGGASGSEALASGGSASAGTSFGSVGGACSSGLCGVICGYYSQYPGGPTQPMLCDATLQCAPVIPVCSSFAGAGGS